MEIFKGNDISGGTQEKNIKISNSITETKNKSDQIIYSDEILNDIYDIIREITVDYDPSDVIKLINISNKISEYNRYQVLYYLIENGIPCTARYSNQLNLRTDDIHIDFFIAGLKNGGDYLFYNDENESFIELYKNPDEIIGRLGVEGFLEQYNYYLNQDPSLGLIRREDTKKAIENYEYIRFDGDTLHKIQTYGMYDREDIIENIFEDSKYAKELFFELHILNKKEKQDLRNMKVDFLNYEYEDDIEMIISDIEDEGKTLYSNMSFKNDKNLDEQIDKLNEKIREICILKNGFNSFQITFTDITGKINHLELTTDIYKLYNNNSYDNISDFKERVDDLLKNYLNFLNINEFDFNVLIFKSNPIKDYDDNSFSNNIYYSGKELKSA